MTTHLTDGIALTFCRQDDRLDHVERETRDDKTANTMVAAESKCQLRTAVCIVYAVCTGKIFEDSRTADSRPVFLAVNLV